jgi:hypothetical protein
MKKPIKLLLFLASAVLFIVVLYLSNGGGATLPPPPAGPGNNNFGKTIDSLSSISYNADLYNSIKQGILGAHDAAELSDEEKNGLIMNLELAKTKSLITAFDAAKSNACLNSQALVGFVKELKGQLKLFKYPEAQKRINRYQNLVSFLGIKNQIQSFIGQEFSIDRKNSLESQIIVAAGKDGVASCANSSAIKNECLNDLQGFKDAYEYFTKIIVDRRIPCNYSLRNGINQKYKYYYNNFICQ